MNKANLLKLISYVEEICNQPENRWVRNELLMKLSKSKIIGLDTVLPLDDIKKDTRKIVEFLEINPSCSIDYSFIKHKLLKTRLELDNLRMENVRYDLKEKDEMKRMYDFCVNAFYQVENLLNFFYYEKYPNINDLLNHFESTEMTTFHRKNERNIGDITIGTKIYSFSKTYYTEEAEIFTGINIDSLRQIRNEGLHRCTRIKNIETENKKLHQFLKYATFDSVHNIVNSLAMKIKYLLLE